MLLLPGRALCTTMSYFYHLFTTTLPPSFPLMIWLQTNLGNSSSESAPLLIQVSAFAPGSAAGGQSFADTLSIPKSLEKQLKPLRSLTEERALSSSPSAPFPPRAALAVPVPTLPNTSGSFKAPGLRLPPHSRLLQAPLSDSCDVSVTSSLCVLLLHNNRYSCLFIQV